MDLAIAVNDKELEQPLGHVDFGRETDFTGLRVEGYLAHFHPAVFQPLDGRLGRLDLLIGRRKALRFYRGTLHRLGTGGDEGE
ncbi:hypothetical protein HAHE_41710 [Haloferula helveola]|uniref:Uncharacterized protein n=1 Tax=Haloferula helveola TaxID=490095 RepID=A0ABN6HAV4_9BACT|nr:hypothetical protein HAHE_41710 [Haloferula helveola]